MIANGAGLRGHQGSLPFAKGSVAVDPEATAVSRISCAGSRRSTRRGAEKQRRLSVRGRLLGLSEVGRVGTDTVQYDLGQCPTTLLSVIPLVVGQNRLDHQSLVLAGVRIRGNLAIVTAASPRNRPENGDWSPRVVQPGWRDQPLGGAGGTMMRYGHSGRQGENPLGGQPAGGTRAIHVNLTGNQSRVW